MYDLIVHYEPTLKTLFMLFTYIFPLILNLGLETHAYFFLVNEHPFLSDNPIVNTTSLTTKRVEYSYRRTRVSASKRIGTCEHEGLAPK